MIAFTRKPANVRANMPHVTFAELVQAIEPALASVGLDRVPLAQRGSVAAHATATRSQPGSSTLRGHAEYEIGVS